MADLVKKLTSRKFLLAVAAFLAALHSARPEIAGALAAIYVLAEAHVDANQGGGSPSEPSSPVEQGGA